MCMLKTYKLNVATKNMCLHFLFYWKNDSYSIKNNCHFACLVINLINKD